jgi:hypothetical protein
MKSLALSMKGLDPASMLMRTAPTVKRTVVNGETVFLLDTKLLPLLWRAIGTSNLPLINDTTLK